MYLWAAMTGMRDSSMVSDISSPYMFSHPFSSSSRRASFAMSFSLATL